MQLNLNIKNFGKLEDAEIRIGSFTVFAGPNNTGKSYVSKLLYSLFNAINASHADVVLDRMAQPISYELRKFSMQMATPMDETQSSGISADIQQTQNHIREMEKIVAGCAGGDGGYQSEFDMLEDFYPDIVKNAEEIKKLYNTIEQKADAVRQKIKEAPEQETDDTLAGRAVIREMAVGGNYLDCSWLKKDVNKLCESIGPEGPIGFLVAGIEPQIRRNLIGNFQTPNLSLLRKNQDEETVIEIEGVGQCRVLVNDAVDFAIEPAGLQLLQEYSRVIYLESPVYWKVRNALIKVPTNSRFSDQDKARILLSGVPDYFYDLLVALGETYSGDVAFPDLLDKLTGKEILGGRISISDVGDLVFQENNHRFPLPLTAMGVTNLGILALLIERKVIDKNSFVFIDEPEAHLHPAWQIAITEILFELSRQGVNIVIATHSADILKWLEVHIKKHPEDEKLVALNQFPANGHDDGEDFPLKMAKIKEELTKPFADLYMAGL